MCSDQEIIKGWGNDVVIGSLLATNENLVYCTFKSDPSHNKYVFYTRQKTLSLYYINSICDLLEYKQVISHHTINNFKNLRGSGKNVYIELYKKFPNHGCWIRIYFNQKYKNVLKFKNDYGAEIRTIPG